MPPLRWSFSPVLPPAALISLCKTKIWPGWQVAWSSKKIPLCSIHTPEWFRNSRNRSEVPQDFWVNFRESLEKGSHKHHHHHLCSTSQHKGSPQTPAHWAASEPLQPGCGKKLKSKTQPKNHKKGVWPYVHRYKFRPFCCCCLLAPLQTHTPHSTQTF